jgi:hypothetical protein
MINGGRNGLDRRTVPIYWLTSGCIRILSFLLDLSFSFLDVFIDLKIREIKNP